MSREPADDLAARLAQWRAKAASSQLVEEDWRDGGMTGSALFERYQLAGNAGVQSDLTAAHEIASLGFQRTSGALRQQFATLLTSVLLVGNRHETDPGRREAVAAMARALCTACDEAGDAASLRREVEVARLWQECARTAGAETEAAEALSIVDRALRNPGNPPAPLVPSHGGRTVGLEPTDAVLAYIDVATLRADSAWDIERWPEAATAYDAAAALLITAVRNSAGLVEGAGGVVQPRRWQLLSGRGKLAARAAYAHLMSDNSQAAVLSLERICDVLGSTDSNRRLLDRLPVLGHAELYERYEEAMGALMTVLPRGDEPEIETARRAATTVVVEIQALPGFERFLQSVSWKQIRETATIVPLVYLAATNRGTAVIVVAGDTIQSQTLEDVDLEELAERAKPFLRLEVEPGTSSGPVTLEESQRALHDFMDWLAEHLLLLVRVYLGDATSAAFVCPGLLGLLPMPATIALAEERLAACGAPSIPSLSVSLVPSARAYLASREAAARPYGAKALVVRDPRPVNPLYGTPELGRAVEGVIRRAAPDTTVLEGRSASVREVLEDLPTYDLVAFWCHGDVDRRFGYFGTLLLANFEVLNAMHLVGVPELATRLLFLGACRAGMPAVDVDGETLALPTAFLGAGAAAVLSAYWRVDELPTVLLLSVFLDVFVSSGDPARALQVARDWLRRAPAEELRARSASIGLELIPSEPLSIAKSEDRPYEEYWYWAAFHLTGA
jgi:hypothetical protein